MARIAVALPLADEDRLASELVRHGHDLAGRCSSADELATVLAAGRTDYALVAATPRYLNSRLIVEADAAGVRIIALVAHESERRHALELGLQETADAASDWSQLELMLLGSPAFAAPAAVDPARGTMIAVWGPAGSPGRTTLSIAIAAELAAAGHSVALADVDTHSGSIAPAIGLLDEAPGFAAACRLAGADSLSRAELERIGQRYASARGGFWVLTGIGRPSRWPELSAERVAATIAECRSWVDYTVLDTGASLENDEEISSDLFAPRRNAATLAALRSADRVVAVGAADPIGLARYLRAYPDLVEVVDDRPVTSVINKVRPGVAGLNPHGQVRSTLQRFGGIGDPILVPSDPRGTDAALLAGRALRDASPRSPALAAISRFVGEGILPAADPATGRRGHRRRRILSAIRAV
ncbi:MAG: regulator [Lacisediminihabitans sp.]